MESPRSNSTGVPKMIAILAIPVTPEMQRNVIGFNITSMDTNSDVDCSSVRIGTLGRDCPRVQHESMPKRGIRALAPHQEQVSQ